MQIAILGCGYVGCALGTRLARDGHHVIGCARSDDNMDAIADTGFTAARIDARDRGALRTLLSDREAVYLTVGAGRGGDYRETYVACAEALVDACRQSPVRRIIYTSSTRVYAGNAGTWVDEDAPLETTDPGATALVDAERALLAGSSDLAGTESATSVVRLAGIYGPGRELAAFALRSAGQTRDDGNAFVNLVHRDDIVKALARLLPTSHVGVLNLCSDEPILRRRLYDAILAEHTADPICWTDSQTPVRGKRVRNDRIKRVLDMTLQHPTALPTGSATGDRNAAEPQPFVRQAQTVDAAAIQSLIAEVFTEYGCVLNVEEDDPHLRDPGEYFRGRGGDFWVVEDDGQIVATAAYLLHKDAGELKCIYVRRPHRGCGWGKRLSQMAIDHIRRAGRKQAILWSDTRFEAAHRLYRSLGFARSGERELHDTNATVEYGFRLAL